MVPSESTENAQAMPMSKTKPPSMTIQASRPEERAFGRQLSTNNGEATGQMHMLAVAPETKDNFNAKAPSSSRGLAVDRKPVLAKQATADDVVVDNHPIQAL